MGDEPLQPGREAARQRALMAALCHDTELDRLSPWLRADAAGTPAAERGLLAYRANAGASAERSLAAAYPVLRQLIGAQSFAALTRTLWQQQPPTRGDLAQFGAALPAFIEASHELAEEPYLADCARLDWAVHNCEMAADAPTAAQGLELLANHDPAELRLQLRPGSTLLSSRFPVATIWAAHHSDEAQRFEPVRSALAVAQAEHAWVWRKGWRGCVLRLDDADAAFVRALLDGSDLAQALSVSAVGFDFAGWLTRALQGGWLAAVVARASVPDA
ncbi:MAG: DNA-binding domain-containing protein [Rubrivivax sp.]